MILLIPVACFLALAIVAFSGFYVGNHEATVVISSHLRGHEIVLVNEEWCFVDTLERSASTWLQRPCGLCGEENTPEGHDVCLGTLPGVMNACCGHGDLRDAYVQFHDGTSIQGQAAITFVKKHLEAVE